MSELASMRRGRVFAVDEGWSYDACTEIGSIAELGCEPGFVRSARVQA